MKKFKTLILLFAFVAILVGGFTAMSTPRVEAANCCWVMVCTQNPPIVCWEECVPCPTFP